MIKPDQIDETRQLIDPFGRAITYLRLSVTDRCDLRCSYCMDENVTFVPKRELLTLEELDRLASAFVDLGVRKIRLTGGEPLVRKGLSDLVQRLSRHLQSGALLELTMTSNATRLEKYASELARAGIRRINISLDTRRPDRFRELSRIGDLSQVLAGIEAARAADLKIKLNMVVQKGLNDDEVEEMMVWAHERSMDLTLIEMMPFGDGEQWLPRLIGLGEIRDRLARDFTLTDIEDQTGGPARYALVEETGGRLGFITPLSGNFCDNCNRIRVTCRGRLYQCLGRENHVDLRAVLQAHDDDEALVAAIHAAIKAKPRGHDFEERRTSRTPNAKRAMSATGG